MNVEQLMMRDTVTCRPETDLAAVALMMWEKDCGAVPVTDDSGHPIGMITDRDISIAGATQRRPLSDIHVSEVKTDGRVVSCHPEQDVNQALGLMAKSQVRRLPVTDSEGRLVGILSMGDIVAHVPESGSSASSELPQEQVIETLRAIMVHH